jgi:PBP1b-binding outer membrane lipoprotein LpoB
MKKTIALIALTSFLFVSCKKETAAEAVAKQPNQAGINIEKSANIDLVKKVVADASSFDLVSFKSNFAPTAIIHDNRNDMTLDENVKMLEGLKTSGASVSLGKDPLIWEVVNDKPNEKTGITNYVISYYEATFSKGGKSAVVVYNMNFAVKDGKIQEEWDVYDSAPIMEVLK